MFLFQYLSYNKASLEGYKEELSGDLLQLIFF